MGKTLIGSVERLLRGICFLYSLFITCNLIILDSFFHFIHSKINALSGHYFSRNFNLNSPGEYLVRLWGLIFFNILGINVVRSVKTELPKDKKDNVLVMFSHGSNLDPMLVHATFPFFPHFVAKKELFKVPLFGRVMKTIGQIPIDRENLTSAIESLKITADIALSGNKTVAIAPEGTRRRSDSIGPEQLLPFKKGPFHLAKAIGVDIIPCVIIGSHRLWPPGQIFPSSGHVFLKYLERIPKEFVQKSSLEDMQAEVKRRFVQELATVPDEVIFSQEKKPYKTFIIYLALLIVNCIFLIKLF